MDAALRDDVALLDLAIQWVEHVLFNRWRSLVFSSEDYGVTDYWKIQITNHKHQTNLNDRNSKFKTRFGHWLLRFVIYLKIGASNLGF
jgi:hypothetical protein